MNLPPIYIELIFDLASVQMTILSLQNQMSPPGYYIVKCYAQLVTVRNISE